MGLERPPRSIEQIGRERVAGARLSETEPIRHLDPTLVALSLMLAVVGALMIYSATYARLQDNSSPPGYYLERQLVFAAVGFIGMMVLALFSYRRLKAWAWLAYTVAVAMLVAVLTPLGTTVAGAQRWLAIGI